MLIKRKPGNAGTGNLDFNTASRSGIALFLERTAFYGLLLTILLTAVPYGTVDPWFKSLFVVLACVFGAARITHAVITDTPLITDVKFFSPVIGVLLLAACQIIPFQGGALSLDPYETKTFILIFAALVLSGEILLRFTTTEKRLRALIYLVLTVGLGTAIFGLARQAFPVENTFLAPFFDDQVQYAQFVNRNHFAFLMEMTLGLLIGLLLKGKLREWVKPLCWIAIALICFAVISTNSRGGILSMTGLILLAVFVHLVTKNSRSNGKTAAAAAAGIKTSSITLPPRLKTALIAAAFTGLLFAAAVFTVAFVGGDAVADRIGSIQTEIDYDKSPKIERLDIWRSTVELIKARPIAGAGFGAYPAGIASYDRSVNKFSLEQAHNDYLEILANGGTIAFLLALGFIAIVVNKVREQFSSANVFRKASCFGAAVGMAGAMLHSMTDFGLHVIVNALIFIVLIVIATAPAAEFRSRLSESENK